MRVIRPETSVDYEAIRAVNDAAFGETEESTLVDRLRHDGCVVASLVAEESGRVVGHVLFSDLPISTARREIPAAALAPLAVHPDWQRRGIGRELLQAGLLACRAAGKAAVIVLGHPGYYRQFGFSPELARGISSPYTNHGDAWMAIELEPGSLADVTGSVTYPPAFN